MRLFMGAVAGLIALAPAPARASDDADLIPADVLDAAPQPTTPAAPTKPATARPSSVRSKIFAENALSFWSPAGAVPVRYPSSLVSTWQNRTSFDLALAWKARPRLTLTLSDRLNVFLEDGHAFVSPDTVRNDLREASLTWEPLDGYYFEAGRINVRNGVALGFNPTDFFKTRTLVGQSSLDPSVIRQNRLGTLMLREQTLWAWGSSSISYAPKLSEPAPVAEKNPLGVDPHFDTTNTAQRVLCTLSFEVFDLSPQLLGYFELHRSKLGLNVSRPIGDALIAYAEWAAGPEQDLSARATAFGRQTGTLPRSFRTTPPSDGTDSLRNDVAAGFSWTVATAVTFNAEYHFHQSGFTRRDWDHWFELGSARNAPAALAGALWFVRAYALDQQEPVSQHQLFVRASWPQAFTPELELSGFAFISLLDGSVLSQLSASYYVSNVWTASAFVSGNFGDRRSERGSVPQRGNVILQVTRYF